MTSPNLKMTSAQYRAYQKTGVLPPQEQAMPVAASVPRIVPQTTEAAVAPESRRKVRSRPRHLPGVMNKTEAAYVREVLEPAMRDGSILGFQFEPLSLRLAKATHYQPDFLVIEPDGISFVEIKGTHAEDDAIAKWKIAANQHWWATFKWVVIKMKGGKISEMNEKTYTP